MKKTLLIGAALLSTMGVFAQSQGTDATPAGYKFGSTQVIPWYDNGYSTTNVGAGFIAGANYLPNSREITKDIWGNMGKEAVEYWNKNQGLMGCAYVLNKDDVNDMDAILEGFRLIDLGGEVGQVLAWQGKDSNLKECLEENYPDVSWNHIPNPTGLGIRQAFNFNFFMNPNDIFTKVSGYYRFRLVINVCHHATDADIDNEIYDFSGETVLKEIYQVNNQNNNTSYIYDGTFNTEAGEYNNTATNDVGVVPPLTNSLFVKRRASGGIVENEYGDPVWDPTKWAVIDYYFNVAGNEEGLDGDGNKTTPARIKIAVGDTDLNGNKVGTKMNNLAILIREASFTKYEGQLTQEIYDQNKTQFGEYTVGESTVVGFPTITLTPGAYNPDAGVEGIEIDVNAPVEYYNLQGVKVANPEKGIYIKKQGKKTSKVVL